MEEEYKISRDAIKVSTIKEFIGLVVMLLILAAFLKLAPYFKLKNIITIIFIAIIVLDFINALFYPRIEYKNWTYCMKEDKVILRYGVFVTKTVVIPIKRIQYVDTATGPILSHFGLTSLSIYTAGGKYEIPYLVHSIAKELQANITNSVVRSLEEDEI